MSAHRLPVRLTPKAGRDFRSILLYTLQTWGDERRRAYRAAMVSRLEMIAQHPYIGQPRDDLFPGCRDLRVEQHRIYYHLVELGSVEVVSILHQRQDPGGKVTLPST